MQSSLGLIRTLFSNFWRKIRFKQPLLIWPSILVLLGLIIYPLGTILLQSVFPGLFETGFYPFSFKSFIQPFQHAYTYHSIINAFIFGFGSALVTAFLGTVFAILVHRRWIHGHKFMNLLIWLVFFTPSYLTAEGWVLMMQKKGVLDVLFHLPDSTFSWFFTIPGLILAMSFRLFPLVYLAVIAGLQGLGSDFEDAARTQGASSYWTFVKIVIPLLLPAILAGATLTFAESASDFGFAAAFVPTAHIPMLTYSIYLNLYQMPVNYSGAGALSVILILIIAIAVLSQRWLLGRKSYSVIQNQIRPTRIDHKPSKWWSIVTYLFLFLVFIMPIGGEVVTSFFKNSAKGFIASNMTFNHYTTMFTQSNSAFPAIPAILRSLELAVFAAITVTLLGVFLGYVINQVKGALTRALYVITMATLTIPGIVLAAGYIFAWNAPYMVPIGLNFYGTLFCVFLAYVAGGLPNGIRLQMASLMQISPSMLQAGQIHGSKTFHLFRKIIFPLVASTTISVLFLIFSHAFFELPSSKLLVPAGQNVFPVVIMHYFNESEIEVASAITVMGIIMVLLVYLIGQSLIKFWGIIRKKMLFRNIRGTEKMIPSVKDNLVEKENFNEPSINIRS